MPWTITKPHALGKLERPAWWKNVQLPPSEFNEPGAWGGFDWGSEDIELGKILSAIAEEVHRLASLARCAIMAEYAGKIAHAYKFLPRHQVAGAVRAVKEARKATLALIKRNATAELVGRRQAAIRAYRKPFTVAKTGIVAPGGKPPAAGPNRI